jgi:hypothetical protein
MTKNIGDKAQEVISNITGDSSKAQASKRAKQFDAKTLEGNINSIENPNYKPSGQSRESERPTRDSKEQVKADARENFN